MMGSFIRSLIWPFIFSLLLEPPSNRPVYGYALWSRDLDLFIDLVSLSAHSDAENENILPAFQAVVSEHNNSW